MGPGRVVQGTFVRGYISQGHIVMELPLRFDILCTEKGEMGNCFRQSAGPNLFKSDWLAGVAKSHAASAAVLAEL
jgi:hypothetical protein